MLYIVILCKTLYGLCFIKTFRVKSNKHKMFSLVILITDFLPGTQKKTYVNFVAFNKSLFNFEVYCFVLMMFGLVNKALNNMDTITHAV